MNPDWYGDSLNDPAPTPIVGYGVWATGEGKAPYLCKDLGRLWTSKADAYAWLDRMLPVPGGCWSYQVLEMREVAR